MITETQRCRTCSVDKPLDDFCFRNDSGKYRPDCKECRRKARLAKYCPDKNREQEYKKKYGVTVSWYDETLAAQGFCCKICGSTESKAPNKSERFVVDHCHTTGRVRGLLCSPCNIAIGMIGDDPVTAIMISEYLQDHSYE